jgi:hypothetical protein
MNSWCQWLAVVVVIWGAAREARAETSAQLLPRTTVTYLEIARPAELWDRVAEHSATRRWLGSDAYLQATRTSELRRLMAVLATFGFAMQQEWQMAVQDMLRGGVTLAIDDSTGGIILLIRPRDEQTLDRFRRIVTRLAREDAERKGEPDSVKTVEYREVPVLQAAPWHMATFSGWLLLTNHQESGEQLLDRYLDGTGGSLAEQPRFQQAISKRPAAADVWGYLDLVRLRELVQRQNGDDHPLVSGRAPNPGVELILGGVLTTIRKTEYVTAFARLAGDSLQFEVTSPHSDGEIPVERQYFFREPGERQVTEPLLLPDTVASLSVHRDVSRMWLHAGDLFGSQVNDQLASADGTLTTLFSGRDFGEDILGAMHPYWRLIVVRQTWSPDTPQPAIRLPSFALVAQLREPEPMQRDLRRVFQNLVGFLNIVGAMNGQPQLDLNMEPLGDGQLITTTYDLPEEPGSEDLPIQYNFSPSLAVMGPHAVLASSSKLARDVATALAQQAEAADTSEPARRPEGEPAGEANTRLYLDIQALADVLSDNTRQLVAQNMLEKGHRRAEAEREIHGLLELLRYLRRAELGLEFGQQARLQFQLDLEVPAAPAADVPAADVPDPE